MAPCNWPGCLLILGYFSLFFIGSNPACQSHSISSYLFSDCPPLS